MTSLLLSKIFSSLRTFGGAVENNSLKNFEIGFVNADIGEAETFVNKKTFTKITNNSFLLICTFFKVKVSQQR